MKPGQLAGLCALCALLLSAFAAQGATAATNGTTAFTCSSSASPKDFKTEHCVPGESGTAFGHVEVAEGTVTHFTASSEKTDATTSGSTQMTMKTTVAGAAVHIDATGMHATGTLENMKAAGSGEHTTSAVVSTFKLTGITETLFGCKVTGKPGGLGTIEFKELAATTAGQEMGIKFSALSGSGGVLAEFELTDCAVAPLTIKLFGSFKCIPNGATIVCNHEEITASKTLRIQSISGPIVGFEGKATVTGSHNVLVEPTKPLSFTTKAT